MFIFHCLIVSVVLDISQQVKQHPLLTYDMISFHVQFAAHLSLSCEDV